jgi:hypothetical protein
LVLDLGILAEVSVEVDDTGQYKRTVVLGNASEKNLRIWSILRAKDGLYPLNPDGDANGDLWPTIEENPHQGGLPWVVWSRSNGQDLDLAWSRWDGAAWLPTQWVESTTTAGDDLDAVLEFDAQDGGRPYTAWWRDEGGFGQIYLSVFLNSRWMSPYRVSDADEDSRYPEIEFHDDGTVDVTYDTDRGLITRTLAITFPDTIRDDIVPLGVIDEIATTPGGDNLNP